MVMSAPSAVVSVRFDLFDGSAKDAVTLVVPAAPLIAAASDVRSDVLATSAEIVVPLSVIDMVPAPPRLEIVAVLVAVAGDSPTLAPAALIAAAMPLAPAFTA